MRLNVFQIGTDYLIVIQGGASHVGAVALGVNYNPQENKANASVIAAPGHKEDVLAHRAAYLFSKALGKHTAVVMGLHYHGLAKDDIAIIEQEVEDLIRQAVQRLSETS